MTNEENGQVIRLVLGDCIEKMRDIPDGTIGAIITDPPYGLEFMGKNWDAPWKYAISEHGFSDGGDRLPAPAFTSSRNPTCQNCGLRQRTWKGGPPACSCGPDWKYSFSEGGWNGKDYPETPSFESSRNPVCQKCHRMKRGSVRHEQCECPEPAFDDVTHRIQDRQKFQAWCETWLAECYRILKPGGTIKAFGGTRMFHRMAAAMESVGFVDLEVFSWSYGSGFPKSLNIGKALDKMAGAEREVVGIKPGHEQFAGRTTSGHITAMVTGTMGQDGGFARPWMEDSEAQERYHQLTAPATEAAKLYEGFGTALKPAWEPVIVGRKPAI